MLFKKSLGIILGHMALTLIFGDSTAAAACVKSDSDF